MKKLMLRIALTVAAAFGASSALAGPFILAGTDADDHGSATASANVNGWLFMQKVLENLAPGVTNANKTMVTGRPSNAANSAFNFSSLNGAGGWNIVTVSAANFSNFFNNTGAGRP